MLLEREARVARDQLQQLHVSVVDRPAAGAVEELGGHVERALRIADEQAVARVRLHVLVDELHRPVLPARRCARVRLAAVATGGTSGARAAVAELAAGVKVGELEGRAHVGGGGSVGEVGAPRKEALLPHQPLAHLKGEQARRALRVHLLNLRLAAAPEAA